MAKVKITGHASGSGVFTITAPNSNTDRTITLPDASVTLGTDATKLPLAGGTMTGNIVMGDDTSIGISDSAERIEFDGAGDINILGANLGINTITPPERLSIHESSTGGGTYLPVAITGANHATGYGVGISFKTENGSPTQKAKAAIIAEGTGEGYNKTSLHIAMSNTNDTSTEVALANSVLEFTMDGRGLSQFTAKAWVNFNGQDSSISARAGHNVSSITDHGTGDYTVNFTNNMANDNYVSFGSTIGASANHHSNIFGGTLPAVGSIRIKAPNSAAGGTSYTLQDPNQVNLIIFGG